MAVISPDQQKSVKSALSWALRPANPVQVLAPITREIAASGRRIRGLMKGLFTVDRGDADLAEIQDARERFVMAAAQNGIPQEALAEALPSIERRNAWNFYSVFVFSCLATLYAMVSGDIGLAGNTGLWLFDHGLQWIFALMLWMRAGLASLRLYQVRIRALVGWREWLRDPLAVLGVPPLKSRIAPLVLALFGIVAFSGAALAEGAGNASSILSVISQAPSQMDLSMNWLQRLFPALADHAGGQPSNADPLAPMLTIFNGLLLLVGMGLLMFHTLSATVYAAHTGRSIGQGKYHGLWAPVRILAGVSLLAPIKGYCAAQILVLKVIVIGYAIANGMWVSYVDRMLSADQVSAMPGVNSGPGIGTAIKVLELEACAVTIQAHGQNMAQSRSWNPSTWLRSSRPSAQLPPVEGVRRQLLGGTATGSVRQGLRADPNARQARPASEGYLHVWDYGSTCGSMNMASPSMADGASDDERAAFQRFAEAKIVAVGNLVSSVRNTRLPQTMMARVVPGAPPAEIINQPVGPWRELGQAAQRYDEEIQAAGSRLVEELNGTQRNRIRETALRLGWASAGALNMTLTRLSSQAARFMQEAVPSVTLPELDAIQTEGAATEQMRMLRDMKAFLQASLREMQGHYDVQSADVQTSRDTAQLPSSMARWMREASQRLALGLQDHTRLNPLRPMESIQNVGNSALLTGQAMLLAAGAAAIASHSAPGQVVGAHGLFNFVTGSFFAPLMIGLLAFGALHAYVLPFIPFIIWFYAVIGVAAMAVELILAAPLAALQHIKADGEEFLEQKQQTFYLMAFNALLKPTLLLFGLVMASVMFVVMANFLNVTMGLAFISSQGDSIIGIVGIFVMFVISFFIHYQLCMRSFGLITKVPEAVADLLGVRDGSRGEHGDSDTIVAGVVGFTKQSMHRAATVAAIREEKKDGKDKPNPNGAGGGGDAPAANTGALSPAAAKGGAAPAGNPKGS